MTKRATSPRKTPHLRLVGGAPASPPILDASINIVPIIIEEPVSARRLADATARINEGDAMSSEMVKLLELYGQIDEGAARDLVRSLVALIVTTGDSRDTNGMVVH